MDYKNVIKSRETRGNILRALRFIPDKQMVKLQYRIKTGRRLNLNNPQRYTEKLQWYKLNYRNPLMVQCVDKYEVRQYVEKQGRGDLLTKCYGVFDRPEDIDFEWLPDQFVLKDTLGGGGNSVILCHDKSKFDWLKANLTMQKWCATKVVRDGGREWPYYSGKNHRIIIEEYLENDEKQYNGINDYKFICLNGKAQFVVIDVNRFIEHRRSIYDTEWNYIDVGTDCKNLGNIIDKPDGFEILLCYAEELSKGFPHVRVDLYWVNDRAYFGELTFYPWSGYVKFNPDLFDFELGNYFSLTNL